MKTRQYSNLISTFLDCSKRYQNKVALRYRANGRYCGNITWSQWEIIVRQTALGLYHKGIRKGDRIAVLSENRPEWTFADFGVLSLGAVTVPIYPSLPADEIHNILNNAGASGLFVSNQEQLDKVKPLLHPHGPLQFVVSFDELNASCSVLPLRDLLYFGRLLSFNEANLYDRLVDQLDSEDLATLIYTSGTTGTPKGVMITHGNFLANCYGAIPHVPVKETDTVLSFLPLSHVFERLAGYYFMSFQGATIAYARSMKTVTEDILSVRPTIATTVPRFFEKIHLEVMKKIQESSYLVRALLMWALRVGYKVSSIKQAGKRPSFFLQLVYSFFSATLFNLIRKQLGGRIRYFISGGAPLGKELANFFHAIGIIILEGYGLTETSPVIAVNAYENFKLGTVGKPLANIKVKIANDGEILTSGPCIMKGYYHNAEATAQVIKDDWLHTGDLGFIDEEGFLSISGRKKDIIVTSGGKNITPLTIEAGILKDPLFKQIVLIGDRRPYLVALIVPEKAILLKEAETRGFDSLTMEQLCEAEAVYHFVSERLEVRMKGLASFERIKYFQLLPNEFTQASGDVTPTLKLKRSAIAKKFSHQINELYLKGEKTYEARGK